MRYRTVGLRYGTVRYENREWVQGGGVQINKRRVVKNFKTTTTTMKTTTHALTVLCILPLKVTFLHAADPSNTVEMKTDDGGSDNTLPSLYTQDDIDREIAGIEFTKNKAVLKSVQKRDVGYIEHHGNANNVHPVKKVKTRDQIAYEKNNEL